MTADPSTLAATGLLAAALFALFAGVIGFLADPPVGQGFRYRLLNLTEVVDVGDVALLGVAVALLLLTPDPPGGVSRSLLLQVAAGVAAIITVYGVIRALVYVSDDVSVAIGVTRFLAALGVAIAAATLAFYAAKESFLKKEGRI
jgi:hypothetical protein